MKLSDAMITAGVFIGVIDVLQLGIDIPTDVISVALFSGGVALRGEGL